jgi:hypothetical protein
MEMEEKMEVEFMVFEAREIDLDYEFDAPKYFDFTSLESIAEAREVQRWFDTAPSCPPSRESQNTVICSLLVFP